MTKRASKGPARQKPPTRRKAMIVPPIALPFEEAVARLLKVKPPKKKD